MRSGGIPLLNTGLAVGGGANLVPIKIDATAQYQPFSDFAAWPNPFSLANNLMAGTVGATYILRGLTLDTILNQVGGDEVGDAVGNVTAGNPLALNLYLTLPAKTLPLLEPLYLTGDVLNAVSFGTLGTLPIRLANALTPALTSLVNLGYTDVVRNADGTYTRTLTDADTPPTPFMTFPHVNPGQAVNDVIKSLVKGVPEGVLQWPSDGGAAEHRQRARQGGEEHHQRQLREGADQDGHRCGVRAGRGQRATVSCGTDLDARHRSDRGVHR